MVNFEFGKLTAHALGNLNKKHEFKAYSGMGHSSCEQVGDIFLIFFNFKASEKEFMISKTVLRLLVIRVDVISKFCNKIILNPQQSPSFVTCVNTFLINLSLFQEMQDVKKFISEQLPPQ